MTKGLVAGSLCVLRLPLLLAFLSLGPALLASQPTNPSVRIAVHAAGGLPIRDVYVGLVPVDQSPGRPMCEIVSATGDAEFSVPPGVYGLMTAADRFQADFRDVRVAGLRQEIMVELAPATTIGGRVVDPEGKPIAGARVCHAPAASARALADMSELAMQHLSSAMRTTTDENGSWRLAASRFPLLIEASGWAPAWVVYRAGDEQKPLDVILQKGSSLRVIMDRIDPFAVITAIPSSSDDKTGIPSQFQARIWGRDATTLSLDWSSLPAGEYKLVASYPDPLRFASPVDVGRVTLASGGSGNVRVTLPARPQPAITYVSFLVPRRTDLSELRAFVRAAAGVRIARHSILDALGGKVIFVDTAVRPDEVYLTTRAELMTATTDSPKKGIAAVEPARTAKGEGRLRLIPEEGLALPAVASVAFNACLHDERIALPVNVGKDGILGFPLVVSCRSLTLSFKGLGALGLTASVGAGEEKWLGDYKLGAPASAEVHAMYAGAKAPGVVVRAMVKRDREKVVVGEVIADVTGVAVMNGLPAGEVTFEARMAESQNVGTATVTLEPGQPTVIDPLAIPEPASLILAADFDPLFKSENPTASLFGLVLQRESNELPKDSRSVQFGGKNREVTFDDLIPGRWEIIALVNVEDVTQPVKVESVELEAGDEKHVSASIKPLVFTGQVLSGGRGVPVSVGIGDPPGPRAVRRDIETTSEGKFKVVLPESGLYRVIVRAGRTSDPIEIGPVAFNEVLPSVRIELPDAALSIQVRSADAPVTDAVIVATMRMDNADGSGVTRLTRRAKTGPAGAVTLENLQPGSWTIEAREPRSGRMAEKTVTVARSSRTETALELDNPNLFNGVVIDERGGLAAGASVDCMFLAAGGALRTVHSDADDSAAFSVSLPDPPPSRLDCGVSTAEGTIGAFVAAPGDRVEFALPRATGSVTILDWGKRVAPDRFWLAAPDGRVFNLSWAARKFGRPWSPLAIARMPSGPWSVVRVDSAAALTAVAHGVARTLPAAATVLLSEGQTINIEIQGDPMDRP